MLKQSKVCVIPDERIVTIDKLPVFSIIEGNIKDNLFKDKEKTKISKEKYQNLNSTQGTTKFYMQLNHEEMSHIQRPS
jgi:hypothetical protein